MDYARFLGYQKYFHYLKFLVYLRFLRYFKYLVYPSPGGGGLLLKMAHMGRLRPKGIPFSGFRYIKGVPFLPKWDIKGEGVEPWGKVLGLLELLGRST